MMIIDKPDKRTGPTSVEAPPSYASALQTSGSSATTYSPDPKVVYTPSQPYPAALFPPAPNKPGKRNRRWFSFGISKTAKQVRSTTQDILRDLVKQHPSIEFASVLDSCAEACAAHGVSLSQIIQDPFIENHLAVYWAIIKRPSDSAKFYSSNIHAVPESDALVMALLAASSPISATTVSEVRLACLANSDHALFQRIKRRFDAFSLLSGADAILLATNGVRMEDRGDNVTVEDVRGNARAFIARFEIIQFQLRMRVSKKVDVEFIAKGRFWRLSFLVTPETHLNVHHRAGSWLVVLTLLEHSPPTWIDSQLVISEPPPSPNPDSGTSIVPTPSPSDALPSYPSVRYQAPPQHPARDSIFRSKGKKSKPAVNLRIKSGSKQLSPQSSQSSGPHQITVSLEDGPVGADLQYEGSSYIDSSGTLNATLEAHLVKPDSDCIIC